MKLKLYKCFEHWQSKGSIYVISDLHYNEINRIKYIRKNCENIFSDIAVDKIMLTHFTNEEVIDLYNRKLVQNIARTVHKNDTLIILGDLGDLSVLKELKYIKCYKVLILGNHDKGVSNYEEVFDEVYKGTLTISDRLILSHERVNIKEYASNKDCMINVHGHTHSSKLLESKTSLCVCLEFTDFKPIRLDNLISDNNMYQNIKDIHTLAREVVKNDK